MISLYVENGIAYVWNADDWYVLRKNHRICGSLIGSIPSYPRQNDFLGLPMALKSEEAALLVDKGICELFEIPNLTKTPSKEEKQLIKDLEQKYGDTGGQPLFIQITKGKRMKSGGQPVSLSEQMDVMKKRKIEQLSQKIDIIIAGKRQKLLSKGVTDIQLDKQTLLQEEINKLPKLASAHVLTHLPTEHNLPTEKKKVDVDILNPSVVKGEGAIKYKIFKNLWEKGHHITNGSKFGCDYLVYPGDPVRFHATYMVRCIYDQAAALSPKEFVAFGRLSVSVGKLAVLAFCNSYGKVEYQTLQWHDNVI